MVRAILDGRKAQTRRVVKGSTENRGPYNSAYLEAHSNSDGWAKICPYGSPGDRLWVRETWRPRISHSHGMDACDCEDVNVRYAADDEVWYFGHRDIPDDWLMPKAAKRGNVSPLYMPRWASRITLEITDIRVERVQGISEKDALAEGSPLKSGSYYHATWFRELWDSIHGLGAWERNDWVWVISFKRLPQ